MMISKLSSLTAISIALTMGGCSTLVKTPYQQPELQIPTEFSAADRYNNIWQQNLNDRWWTLFGDSQLNQLVEQAIAKNTDLADAGLVLKRARLQADLSRNQQGLRVNSSASTGHQYQFSNGNDSSNGLSLSAGVSYELDLFGKLSMQTEVARWEALATEQDLQATAQSIIASMCQLYWQLANINGRSILAEQSLESSQKSLKLVQAQYRAGAVSGLDLAQAEQAVVSQRAQILQFQQQRAEARNAMATLLHQHASALNLNEPTALINRQRPEIQAGLPIDVISRRPDIKASQIRLQKSWVEKDAVKASYYPSISLTSSLGSSSTSLTDLLKNPLLSLGAGLSLPFLQYNDMQRNLEISDIDFERNVLSYRQTLFAALNDIESKLSNRDSLQKQYAVMQQTLALAEKTERLYEIRYRAGAVNLKPWLDAQDSVRSVQNNLSQLRLQQYDNDVLLLQALGGSPIYNLPE